MNKTELIAAIAKKTDLSKKDAEKALKACTDTIAAELKKGEKPVKGGMRRCGGQGEL